MKCSGPNVINWETPRPVAAVSRQYNALIDLFGANRCFFGSNFPVEKMGIGYAALWNTFKRIAQGASVADKEAIFSATAQRVYQLPQK